MRNTGIAVVVGATAVAMLAGSCAAFGEQAVAGGSRTPGVSSGDTETAAAWTPRKFTFTYSGFTTKYSCDGLADKVKAILLKLGARKDDLVVRQTGCTGQSGRPVPFPGVDVRMSVLTPASDGTVPAQWKAVELKMDRDPVNASGECELLEQVKQRVLPLFSARGTVLNSTCVPHQLSASGASLQAQVLTTAAPAQGS
ncbi:MAG TPA: hypothetical protein VGM84_05545 [Steroidobacteraceae bacterium]|jgi:hypothetical protein